MKTREKFQRWLATVRRKLLKGTPLVGLETITMVADDLRKLGLGAMVAGIVGVYIPATNSTSEATGTLLATGAIIWAIAIAMNARVERVRFSKED